MILMVISKGKRTMNHNRSTDGFGFCHQPWWTSFAPPLDPLVGHESFGGMGMENQPSVDDFLCFS